MVNMSSRPYLLYIEDDIEDVELLKYTLANTPFDFDIVHHVNGVEALNFLDHAKKYGRLPEMLLLDINLPKIDGKEMLVHLRTNKDIAKIPTMVLSTSSMESDISYFRQFRVPYILKPGDMHKFKKEVINVMRNLLNFDVDVSSRKSYGAA